jgi:hypothetical protein
MNAIRQFRVVVLVLVSAIVSACGSDSSVAPDRRPADLGEVLTEMSLPSFTGAIVPELSMMPSASTLTPSSCSYSGTSQSFVCPVVTVSGLTLTRSFTLLTASGTPQSQFDPTATAAVRTSSTMAGTIASDGITFTLDGHEELTLSGLLTGIHVLNGTSVMNMHGTDASSSGPFAMSITTTIDKLVLPATPADKWPKSGSILMDLTDNFDGTSMTMHMQMTFNGTSKVLAVMTSDGFTTRCTVDLASQSPVCAP